VWEGVCSVCVGWGAGGGAVKVVRGTRCYVGDGEVPGDGV